MIEHRPRLNDPLWNRIIEYEIDDPYATFPFSKKLAKAQNWNEPFTRKAIEEYKKFIYLCCISPHGASPSPIVDEVWHLHLTYTIDYWQRFCRVVLQKEIHHQPSRGGPGEKHKHDDWYDDTLKLYTHTFGADPPEDIWQVNKQTTPTTEPPGYTDDRFFELGSRKRFLLLLLPFIIITILYGQSFPFALSGPHFLVFFISLAVAVITAQYISIQGKWVKLEQLLPNRLEDPDRYELSYLAGGKKRLVLHYIADLITKGVLTDREFGYYNINKEMLQWSVNPVSDSLAALNMENATVDELVRLGQRHAEPYEDKYQALQHRFDDMSNNIILPLIVLLLGLARLCQGVANGKPVSYLLMCMVGFVVAAVVLHKANTFYATCKSIFTDKPAYTDHLTSDLDRLMVFTGFAAFAGLPKYDQLNKHFGSNSGGGDSSGGCGSGCGSSCGGGCGGGCGGCGS